MHNITERDGLFTVRSPAWHGLGTVLAEHPTKEEAKAIAHPWEPTTEPLYRVVKTKAHSAPDGCSFDDTDCPIDWHWVEKTKAVRVDEFDLVVRDDDGFALGVKPHTRSLVTNEEMYDIAEAIKGSGTEVLYETGGSLKGGRKVWLLLRFAEPFQIGGRKGTETIPYFALQNSNDGSGAFRGQGTSVCIVCDNTSHFADWDSQMRGTEFTFNHTAKIGERIEQAKEALVGWRESVVEYQRITDHLIDVKIDRSQRTAFVQQFIPMPQETLISERVRNNVIEARTKMFDIFDSPTQEGIDYTAYGLVQAAIEYSQWYRKAKSAESRFQRAYLDRSRLTADAVQMALAVSQ